MAGLTIMLAACTLIAQITVFGSRQLRAGAMRQLAAREAANVLDRLVTISSDTLNHSPATTWPLSDETARQLPGGELHVTVDDESGSPAAQRIAVEVTWTNPWGSRPGQVRLVSWRYDEMKGSTP